MLSYQWRLLCLSAAVFFLVNLALGAAVALASPLALRLAGRANPRRAARCLLALRLLPAALAAWIVLAVCVPSYLWLEPGLGVEYVGAACLAAAGMGAAIWSLAAARVWGAAVRSRRCLRDATRHCGYEGTVRLWVVDGPAPSLALVGLVRPRLIVSRAVLGALAPEQLAAAFDHERAHWSSRDNLKRLLLLLAPGLLPFCGGFGRLERAWARFTEWAADDSAVAGHPRRSLSLAAALVRVARLQAHPPALPLATSLLGEPRDLAVRVARLLRPAPASELAQPRGTLARAGVSLALAACAAAMLHPATLSAAHRLLERLME